MSIGRFTGQENNPLATQPRQQQQNPAPGNPGSVPPQQQSQSMYSPLDNSQQQPDRQQETGGLEGSQDPMDKWAKMLDNPSNENSQGDKGTQGDQNSGNQEEDAPKNQLPGYEDIRKVFDQQDLTSSVDDESLQAAMNGDGEAMRKVLASVARDAAGYSSFVSMKGMDHHMNAALEQNGEKTKKSLQSDQRTNSVVDAVTSNNPQFGRGQTKQVVTDVTKKFMQRFPDAQPSDIAKSVESYMKDWAASISGGSNPNQPGKQKNSGETDWEAHLAE